jgi:hypothetical protein
VISEEMFFNACAVAGIAAVSEAVPARALEANPREKCHDWLSEPAPESATASSLTRSSLP